MVRFLIALGAAAWLAAPAGAALEYPIPPEPPGFSIAHPRHALALRDRPHGRAVAVVPERTEFGSRQTLAVVTVRGRWLGVTATEVPNRRLGWVRRSEVRLSSTHLSLRIDLSRRVLVLEKDGIAVRRMRVGVGRSGSPTPTGRTAVTDKLSGDRYGPYYGCCILALSAHQPNLPAGWTGGDRIAIHGTNAPATIGAAASAGCLHAGDGDLRFLLRRVPLGTPVFVHA
jgi:lipoprotein-anchoring transpeptidase ErfK/SrfK